MAKPAAESGKRNHQLQIDRIRVERLRQEGLELVLDYPEGDEVSAMADGTDRIGHVIVKTDREAELDEQMKRVYRCIWIDGKIWRQSGKRKQQNKNPESFQDLRRGAKGFQVLRCQAYQYPVDQF